MMILKKMDLWEGNPVVITTNGFITKNGRSVMERGYAKEAAQRYKDLPKKLGAYIQEQGNNVHALGYQYDGKYLFSFPVKPSHVICNGDNVVSHMRNRFKPGDLVPGWAARADLSIIEKSCKQLVTWVNLLRFDKIYMPRPGCGAGELSWEEVKNILKKHLDSRFIICHK